MAKVKNKKSRIVNVEGDLLFRAEQATALTSTQLRMVADELDRQNAEAYNALEFDLNTGEEKGLVEALDMIDLLVDEVQAYQEPRRPKDPISKFEQYVTQERRPLLSQRPSDEELEFLAIANAFGGEAGELQDAVKKILRSGNYDADTVDAKGYWQDFVHEAGDVLHYLVRLLLHAGWTLEEILQANINKLEARKLTNETQTCQFTVSSSPFEL